MTKISVSKIFVSSLYIILFCCFIFLPFAYLYKTGDETLSFESILLSSFGSLFYSFIFICALFISTFVSLFSNNYKVKFIASLVSFIAVSFILYLIIRYVSSYENFFKTYVREGYYLGIIFVCHSYLINLIEVISSLTNYKDKN